jgi:hypothetical protein
MKTEKNILGCFVSGPALNWNDDLKTKENAAERGKLFRTYIWGENGIATPLRKLNHEEYGEDLSTILLQFYLNQIPYELSSLREIENYRKKEKSIGIPIIINEDNFFSRTEDERRLFLTKTIFDKISLLEETVKKKKLDTNINKLKRDVENILHHN